jgi:Holliday junction resolvasome RuvABC endonuclease subunit
MAITKMLVKQVAKMLQQLWDWKIAKNLDSTDGLAAAVCH